MQFLISHTICWGYDGADVLITDTGNQSYRLSGSAAFMWECFKEPRTLEEVVELVLKEYEIGRDRALADTRASIEQLLNRGFLLQYQSSRAFSP